MANSPEYNLVQQKKQIAHLTPTGLLMEGDSTQPRGRIILIAIGFNTRYLET